VRYFEQRPERLERALASREPEVVVALLQFSNEPVIGWKDKHGFDCRHLPDETEEELLARAEADARARAVPEAWGGIVLIA
jgi:hypothetical protein